jgi:hypothetical protein
MDKTSLDMGSDHVTINKEEVSTSISYFHE